ncbi:AAA family ATPase [Paracoccus sp. Z330]|uniref:AAA family ATPase n=1 Tax=Paracoccus onchidii TaxID=3017813 RepID=A0ABT4ZKQ1_9RHOB|nr:AAA family ATPase [Paracoccus onchidii]MDB6179311.1 AAA family ATPase [Paracoccus onchidii]
MKIIACYSNKGGVGKSAAAVNLAHAAASAGVNTLLCDLDPQGASGFYYRVKPSKKLQDDRFFTDVKKFTNAIKASDYPNLDILPANMSYRDFDVFLSRMKNSRSRLKKALKSVDADYDLIILDCPPNLSTLSENVFRAADAILVPVVPTTLSERTFEQITEFFRDEGLSDKKLVPFFSMVQRQKTLHGETMARMRETYGKRFLDAFIPFTTDIERMGAHRAPVATYAARKTGGRAYDAFWQELSSRLKLT